MWHLSPVGSWRWQLGGSGTACFGTQLDYSKLEFTQLVAVGFGNAGSINGDLLTLLAERQGGIYMFNPTGGDLKSFFAKAFGQLSSELLLADPEGTLAANACRIRCRRI